MIYNAERNFLFVHIQKTAGTAMTSALTQVPGSQYVQPAHMRLCDVRIPRRKPVVIACVRDPWARLASWWFMMKKKGVHNDFSAYLLSPKSDGSPADFSAFIRRVDVISEHGPDAEESTGLVRKKRWRKYQKSLGWNQSDYLVYKGRDAVDLVLRFERLAEDWEKLLCQIQPETPISLPEVNRSTTEERSRWRELYSDGADIDFVHHQFRRDIARWGYQPPC
jgi:hypothetical protein